MLLSVPCPEEKLYFIITQATDMQTDMRSVLGRKGEQRIHLYALRQLKGLFWVTGWISFCSSLLFCWVLPGATGWLAACRYLSLFDQTVFYLFHFVLICLLWLCFCLKKIQHKFYGFKQSFTKSLKGTISNSHSAFSLLKKGGDALSGLIESIWI